MLKELIFTDLVNLTLKQLMKSNKNIVLYGLGVDDPRGVFGTTQGLKKLFGPGRVFDMPASENAMTGIGVGMSLNGIRPIMNHQRMDFFLLAMDQLINNAAKWKYMFGGQQQAPIIVRLIVGRGWGQGPTHSQNFQNLFANIPGLNVYIPSLPSTMRSILKQAVKNSDPTIIIEHRWLHNIKENIDLNSNKPLRGIKRIKKGNHLTIVTSSYSTLEIMKIYETLTKNKISLDHFDVNIIKPFKFNEIFNSVKRTGKLLILDNSVNEFCSFGSEVIAQLIKKDKSIFKKEPIYLSLPDVPAPTSYYLTKKYYHSEKSIINTIEKLLNKNINYNESIIKHDVPDSSFRGPF
jgi:pyruvate dehydrogenase E1 component beta subunit